jgi:hypothetical protein
MSDDASCQTSRKRDFFFHNYEKSSKVAVLADEEFFLPHVDIARVVESPPGDT